MHCKMAPMIFDPISLLGQRLFSFDTHDPCHRKPHAKPSPEFLANEERHDAAREGSQIIYTDDDALECTARLSESVAPVFVAYDAREDTLVVTKEDYDCWLVGKAW